MSKRAIVVAALAALLVVAPAQATFPDLAAERQDYQQALKALGRGDGKQFRRLQQRLKDYPLQSYLQYADLKRRLSPAVSDEVRQFLAQNSGPLVARLRRDWLRVLGKRRHWVDYLNDYQTQSAPDLRCYYYRARLQGGGEAGFDAQNKDLWLIGQSQHKACDVLFDHWRRQGWLTETLFSERAELAVKAGNPKLARYLARGLPQWRRAELDRWIALRARPSQQFRQASAWQDTAFHRQILSHELVRQARSNNDQARAWWRGLKSGYAWDNAQRDRIQSELALFYATDYPSGALAALQALPDSARTEQINEWIVRVAIKESNWPVVARTIATLTEVNRSKPRWRYWQARAFAELDDPRAKGLFSQLATETNFHGFLAADQLAIPYSICPAKTARVSQAGLANIPGVARAFELFRVADMVNARREWNAVVRQMDTDQRIQLALLAADQGWHHRAILTLADESQLKEYAARFPLAWNEQFTKRAQHEQLDQSLVIAVARSESALMPDAISSAGARGLMQVTPDTGRRVAKSNRWRRPSNWDLLQPEINIRLGTAYLDELFSRFEHPLLVLGAYNAGPHVIERWDKLQLPAKPDQWIESLPYHETRDYIARVLAFTVIYDWRRTRTMQRLSARMPPMRAKAARFVTDPASAVQPVCAAP